MKHFLPAGWIRLGRAALAVAALYALAPQLGVAADPEPRVTSTASSHPGYCSVQRGSVHCHRRPGFEVHAFWDREYSAHPRAHATGAPGTAPWPLSNVLVDVERDTLLYHRKRRRLLVLNPSAAAILRLCDGTRPVHEIAVCVGEKFVGGDQSSVEGDVHRTVQELVDMGIVTRE